MSSDEIIGKTASQSPIEEGFARPLVQRLLVESQLYKKGKQHQELLDFVARLRNVAPFNAMLLQIQKPGTRFVASALDWHKRFRRKVKIEGRPLIILRPFGPIALVYDVTDTEGKNLPEDVVSAFPTIGKIDERLLGEFRYLMEAKNIGQIMADMGDGAAGSIWISGVRETKDREKIKTYQVCINKNHPPPTQFATLMHELGHLFLGHLGGDRHLKIPKRSSLEHRIREIEAESVAYILCARQDIKPKSQSYLKNYVDQETTTDLVNLYQIMLAAGKIESMLKISRPTKFHLG